MAILYALWGAQAYFEAYLRHDVATSGLFLCFTPLVIEAVG